MMLEDEHISCILLHDANGDVCNDKRLQQNERIKRMQCVLSDLSHGRGEVRLEAAREIRRLTKCSIRSRTYFGEAGAVAPLVSMLKSSNIEAKEAALLALLNLAVRHERNKVRIVKAGAISPLIELLQSAEVGLRESATAVILTLSAAHINRSIIGTSGAIPLLIKIVISGSIQSKVDAVIALLNLSTLFDNTSQMLAADAGVALTLLLKDSAKSSKVAEKVMSLLELLSKYEEGRRSVLRENGGLLAIVEVLEEGSVQGREHAVGTLLTMCQSNRCKYREAILEEGVIPGLLELTVQGTPSAQDKAKKLLELLRDSSKGQRSSCPSPPGSAMLANIVYEIIAHAENAEAGTETARRVLSEMVQLRR
ncbi:hypothetical protein KP509_02G037500 [Ceratopteris richardii]|uniref:U-box domain-containing protein n=1 Tax=Ceratopteris richardii TaxID=49495 RepID=A0A8T2V8T1_CERRI|nr:hypothetical protein KP509_02G037500 [Ceratopteris richardii]